MLKNLYIDLHLISPEILIALGSFFGLLVGVFKKGSSSKITSHLMFLVLAASIYQILNIESGRFLLFNDSLLISKFTQFTKIVIIACNLVVLLTIEYFRGKNHNRNQDFEIPILIALSTLGMCLLVSSNSLLTFYLGLELFSLGLYILIATDKKNYKSIEASLKYFILGAISSGIFLFGASLIYGYTGAINFDEISFVYSSNYCDGICDSPQNSMLLVGLLLILITAMFKLSLAPFHNWTPDVYEGSPSEMTMLLASSAKYAVLMIFLRLVFEPLIVIKAHLQQILIIVAILSLVFGNIAAIVQQNIKRMMAYSSIGHMGFILMSIVIYDKEYLKFTIFYAIVYIILILTFFALVTILNIKEGFDGSLKRLNGLSKRSPFISIAFVVILFSMAGIPPFAGFFAKFYIFMAVIKSKFYYLAAIAFATTVIGVFYYLNIIKAIYFETEEENSEKWPIKLNIIELSIIALCVAFNLFYIFNASYLLELIGRHTDLC
jgi:NADH-quinone oxidoreductase subunit N